MNYESARPSKKKNLISQCELLTFHGLREAIRDCFNNVAHGHATSLQHFLNDELAGVAVERLGGVDVARVAEDPQNEVAAGAIFAGAAASFAARVEHASSVLHQHAERLFHLPSRAQHGHENVHRTSIHLLG